MFIEKGKRALGLLLEESSELGIFNVLICVERIEESIEGNEITSNESLMAWDPHPQCLRY